MKRPPGICYHRGARRYYVTLDGRERYLHDGPRPKERRPPADVQAEYHRVLAAWLTARTTQPEPVAHDPSVRELADGYLAFARTKFTPAEVWSTGAACEVLAGVCGELPARLLGPKLLREVRAAMAAKNWGRKYVNDQLGRVRRLYRWAVAEELVPEVVWRALKALPGLRRGEGGLREPGPILDVPDAVVEATLPCVDPPSRADLIRVHRLIGCRADEACEMRTCDFERLSDPESPTGEIWRYTPAGSKNWAAYWVGPRAQAILLPLLRADEPTAWLWPNRRGLVLSRSMYRETIYRALAAANAARAAADPPLPPLPKWTPLQIRHAAAEEARAQHERGIEATQARLRHRTVTVSQVYAHNLDDLGKDVARRLG